MNQDSYKTSGGTNGLGIKATNALSSMFRATAYRNGKAYSITFENGKVLNPFKTFSSKNKKDYSGSLVEFCLNKEFFVDAETITVSKEWFIDILKSSSYLNAGVLFDLDYDGEQFSFKSENGLSDLVNNNTVHTPILKEPLCISTTVSHTNTKKAAIEIEVDLAFTYQKTAEADISAFCNSIKQTEGGTHVTGFKQAIGQHVRKFIATNNMLKGKDAKLIVTSDDTLEGIVAAISVNLPEPVFEGQHKQKLKSSSAKSAVLSVLNEFLEEWLAANPNEAKTIAQRAIISAKANLAAKTSRDATRKKASDGFASLNTVSKLTKCSSDNPEECELFIVEGRHTSEPQLNCPL